MDLYLSKDILEESMLEEGYLCKLIREKLVNVFLDIEEEDLNKLMEPEASYKYDCIGDIIRNNIPLWSGYNRIKRLLNNDREIFTPSSAVFIIDSSLKGVTDDMQRQSNIIRLSKDNYLTFFSSLEKAKFQKYFDPDTKDSNTSWDDIFSVPSTPTIPFNAAVFSDLYLFTEKHNIENISNIIAILFGKVKNNVQTQILFIIDEKSHFNIEIFIKSCKDFSEKIIKNLPQEQREKIRLEYIVCNRNYKDRFDLYKHAHNRKLITNFTLLSAEHTLAVFGNEDEREQRITYESIFNSECLYEHNSILNRFAKDVKYGIKCQAEDIETPYHIFRYICSEKVKQIKLKDIKNRLIMERIKLKEGNKCWYLSVPNNSDWLNLKTMTGIYNPSNYVDCIADLEPKPVLTGMIEKIKKIFNEHQYTPGDENEQFYWICASTRSAIKTIHVNNSKIDTKPEKCYQKNCFKNKEDAEKVLAQMKLIFGIDG